MTDSAFPSIVKGSGDLAAHIAADKIAIDAQLAESGAVLFRGFDVPDAQAFDAAVVAYGEPNFPYAESLSNAVRVNVTDRVFTANEAPPDTSIYLHHEMAQTPVYPSKLFFYCEIAPGGGGATPLCRSDILLDELAAADPDLVDDFAAKGVRYTNVMPGDDDAGSGQGRSWRSTLSAQDRDAAEARLRALGYDWEWRDDESLRATTPVLDAVRTLPDGRRTFFNQLIAAFRGWSDSRNDPSKAITFGDGTPITTAQMADAIALSDALTYDLDWQAGDVALVDNFLVMHGRRPFEGKRRVLASLIQ
ncbi:TauD/TfdA family dioxygenase [Parasphingopyxis sp.]|uniref:TauD/TfdA family dioxygenase n=1 Tax=Parasphingopyxis sp. TaxID=1920299 RepID=UPI0026059C75|nr:TauD/TfdA family dioxygenase [Parasphingopyxis sp.]